MEAKAAAGNGHGTHCAGTALGTQYGVAKGATLHGVRVLGCDGGGTSTGVIQGMNWVVDNAIQVTLSSHTCSVLRKYGRQGREFSGRNQLNRALRMHVLSSQTR